MNTRLLTCALRTAIFAICLSQTALSQNQITGNITNSKGEGIFYATVALYKQADSTVAAAESSDAAGEFALKNIPDGRYYLEVTMLGYIDERLADLEFPKDNRKNFGLQLHEEAQSLATVEVTAKAPLLEQRADRLIVNVENNLASLNNNLLDVMKKVPGVLVVGDKLRMAGQSNVTILINGKTTKYMDVDALLKDIPGDNIKRVEVIHQPGAEFEAEGTGPIINIILKKNSLFGANGSLTSGLSKGHYWRYRTGLSLSHYQGNFNVSGSASVGRNSWYEELNIVRKVGPDTYVQNSQNPNLSNFLRGNLSLDWDLAARHRLGFSSQYVNSKRDYVIENTTDVNFSAPESQDLRLLTGNEVKSSWKMMTVNPYYTFEIDTTGQKLDFDVNLVRIESDGTNLLQPEEVNAGIEAPGQLYEQPGQSDIFTTSLDYTYPFSKDLKLQAGGRYSRADLDNDLRSFLETSPGQFEPNLGQSNHYLFDETIWAGYTKLDWKLKKWSGTAGLRYEDSQSEGYSVTLDSAQTRHIGKLFPSASLSREVAGKIGASVAYSYRIDRPHYGDLNPFVYYLDPYTYEQGNPRLRPSLTHSTKFSLTYDNQPFFNIEYKYTNDAMVEVTEQNDATGETYLTNVNLESFKVLNISLFFPLDFIPKASGYGGVIANNSRYESPFLNEQFNRKKWDVTAFLQVNYTLPGKIDLEASGWWNSGPLEGIINAEWMFGTDFGISRKFFDEKLKLSLGVENLFNRYFYGEVRYANMDFDVESIWDAPVYNFQASYKFGNQHMKGKGSRKSSAEEELKRAQEN
jgi:outer membrane receptor for ferrienterochelin and colicin